MPVTHPVQKQFDSSLKVTFAKLVSILISAKIHKATIDEIYSIADHVKVLLTLTYDFENSMSNFKIAIFLKDIAQTIRSLCNETSLSEKGYTLLGSISDKLNDICAELKISPMERKNSPYVTLSRNEGVITQLRVLQDEIETMKKEYFFADHVSLLLGKVKTDRTQTKTDLFLQLFLLELSEKPLNERLDKQKQKIIDTYFEIRKSRFGSAHFFGGSRLGHALEKFIKNELGMDVPHYVKDSMSPANIKMKK